MVRFDGLPRISDNLRRGIGEFNSRRNSITEEVERFKADHPEIREWGDPRDFCEMVPFSLDDDEETIRRRAQEYLEAYYDSEHPERRTALLDEFYDAREALDVGSLDLSTLQGQDPGTPGPHGLTASEYDMFRLLRAFRADQAYATKLTHNPGYAAQRFSDPGRRAAYDASMDVMVGAVDMYFSNYLLPMNGLNQLLEKDETPADLRWMFIQTEAADRMEGALARQRAQMRALKPELPEIPLVLRFPEEMYWDPAAGEPDAAQLRAAEAAFDRTFSGFFQNGFGGVKQQKQIGIDEMDLIFVDGMSANEFLSRRFPGRAMNEAQKKQQLLLSLQEGGHLLEAGSYQPNGRGEDVVQLTPVRLDLHGMDKAEKRAKHSAIRRLFDFGPFKIKTTADRQDALQQEDAQRSGRHRVIRAVMQDRRQQGLDLRVAVDRAVERINQRQKQREDVKISALSAAYNSKQKLAALKKEKEELLEKTGELRGLQDGAGAEAKSLQERVDAAQTRLEEIRQEQVEATVRRRVADAVEPRLQAINTLLRAAAEGMPGQEQLAAGMEWEHLELPTPEDAKLVRDYADTLLTEEEYTSLKDRPGLQNSPLAQRLMKEAKAVDMELGDYVRQQAEQAAAIRKQLQPQAEQAEKRLANALLGDGKAQPGVTSLSRQELLHAAGMEKDPLPPAAEVRAPEVSAPEVKAPEVKAPEVKAPEAESAPVKAPEQMESRVRASLAELQAEEPEKAVRQRRESVGRAAPGMEQKEAQKKDPDMGSL